MRLLASSTQTMSEFVRRTLLRAVMARSLMKQHPKVEQPAAPASPMVTHPRHEDPGTDPRVAAEIEAARARGLARRSRGQKREREI